MRSRLINGSAFKAYGALLCVYIAWGTTFAAIHLALKSLTPMTLGFQRFFLVGVLLFVYCLLKGERFPDKQSWQRNLIAGFFLYVSGNALSIWTLNYLPTGLAAAVFALNPFYMVGMSYLLPPRESVTPAIILGLILGFGGLLVTLWPQLSAPQAVSPIFILSITSLIFVGLSWAYGSVYFRRGSSSSSLLMNVAIQNLVAGICMFTAGLAFGDNMFDAGTLQAHLAIGYLIIVGSIVGQSCFLYAVEHLPVAVSSTYSYVTPVVTMIVGWLLLHEAMTPNMVVGMTVILLGVSLIQKRSLPNPKQAMILEPIRKEDSHDSRNQPCHSLDSTGG